MATNSFCAECGAELSKQAKFCSACGTSRSLQVNDATSTIEPSASNKVSLSDPVIRKGLIAGFQLLLAGIAFFYIYSHYIHHAATPVSAAVPQSQSTSTATQTTRSTVYFSGSGGLSEQTAPQELSGSYTIHWKTLGNCSYYASIGSTDIFDADAATSGTNNINNLQDGNYSISMITGPAPDCAWNATFTPSN